MATRDPSDPAPLEGTQTVTGLVTGAAGAAEAAALAAREPEARPRVGKGYLAVLVLSYFALYLAWIAPTSFSLAIRIEQLDAAGRNTALALVLGVSGVVVLVTGPVVGVLSDRTRLRFGPRRTWMLGGMLLGLVGSLLVGVAPTIPALLGAWILAYIGYSAAGAMFLTHLGDRLPPEQQGRVAGFTGAVTQVAPVLGVAVAGAFVASPVALFAAPAAIAFALGLVFVAVMRDPVPTGPRPVVSIRQFLDGFWFDPRRHPNFAWVWISRATIFLALSFMQVYSIYLLGDRLALNSAAIAGLVATAGLLGVAGAIVASVVSGTLSDRFKTRKPFIVGGALLLAAGLVIVATVSSVPHYFVGTVVSTLGVGCFAAIDQAIGLDTLPTDQGQNGRFIGIFNLANQIAQAAGPFLAGAVIALAAGNYSWVYFVAAALAVLGGLLILPVRPGRARTVERAVSPMR